MGIKSYNPYTPSRRHMTGSDFSEITAAKPEKSLVTSLKKNAGRNNQGKITVSCGTSKSQIAFFYLYCPGIVGSCGVLCYLDIVFVQISGFIQSWHVCIPVGSVLPICNFHKISCIQLSDLIAFVKSLLTPESQVSICDFDFKSGSCCCLCLPDRRRKSCCQYK